MPRLLLLTPAELSRDTRARRTAAAAVDFGFEVVGLCGQISGEEPLPLDHVVVRRVGRRGRSSHAWRSGAAGGRTRPFVRELRGLYRLARLFARTALLVRAGRTLGRFDVVHANDFDTLPAAWLLARATRSRLVYDAHELYSAFEADPPRAYRAVARALEARLARQADAVTTVSQPLAYELQRVLGLDTPPLVVLNAPQRSAAEPESFESGPLRAIYQGGLGPGRELADVLRAAEAPDVAVTLRVVLADQDELRAAVADRGLAGRVAVADPVPPDRAVDALHDFEVGIIFDRPYTRNNELSFPNKFFEYLMGGLAVVAPRLPALAPVIEAEGVGVTFDPSRADGLPSALTQLARDRQRLNEMRGRARRAARERFNAEAAAAVLAEAWNAASPGRSGEVDRGPAGAQ
jgi:glycosyltransferase involved in cell wall biosynthesis